MPLDPLRNFATPVLTHPLYYGPPMKQSSIKKGHLAILVSQKGSLLALTLVLALSHVAMARHGQYDEEAREAEKSPHRTEMSGVRKAARGITSGVKEATVDSTTGLLSDTAEATKKDPPVLGTLEGARAGGAKAVEHAVKGAFKVATLGYADTDKMQVEQPKANTDEVTKFKIGF
jgi:hypothetical protein